MSCGNEERGDKRADEGDAEDRFISAERGNCSKGV